MEKPRLVEIIMRLRRVTGSVKYLDFACGSGRVISAVLDLVTEGTGVDISSSMLAVARARLPQGTFREGDILSNPGLIARDYDAITAFRFFLNAESPLRLAVMTDLSGRLRDENSRLIFNVHGNRYSYLGLRRLLRFTGLHTGNLMTASEARQLADAGGLDVETWWGFGIVPRWFFRHRWLRPIASRLDRWATRQDWLHAVGRDLVFVCRRKLAS